MKQYTKTHLTKDALDAHVRNIQKRSGTCSIKGLTVTYGFPPGKKKSPPNLAQLLFGVARRPKQTRSKEKKVKPRRYDTREKQIKALNRKGRFITFKDKYKKMNFGMPQIAVEKLEKARDGRVRILGLWNRSTHWFKDLDALLEAVDWDWMDRVHSSDPQFNKYDKL